MPALPLASSKRMDEFGVCAPAPPAGIEGVCAPERREMKRQNRRERWCISVPSPFPSRGGASEVDRRGALHKHLRNAILRRVFRSGMAAHAIALLASTDPEPAVFLAHDVALSVEKDEADGTIGGRLHEERAVGFDRGCSHRDGAAGVVLALEANARRS